MIAICFLSLEIIHLVVVSIANKRDNALSALQAREQVARTHGELLQVSKEGA